MLKRMLCGCVYTPLDERTGLIIQSCDPGENRYRQQLITLRAPNGDPTLDRRAVEQLMREHNAVLQAFAFDDTQMRRRLAEFIELVGEEELL